MKKVVKTTGEDDIILTTKSGIAIRFKEKDARPMGRAAAGVKGIRLKKGDEVISMDVIEKNPPVDEKTKKPVKAKAKIGSSGVDKVRRTVLAAIE